jgi:diguanylate cyclase (GGDEF)-like protein
MRFLTGLALALVALAMSPAFAAGLVPEKLVVVTDESYPPYLFREDDGHVRGIVKDRWDLWSAQTGVPVEVRGMSWSQAQDRVRSGEADVIDVLAYTTERASRYEFSRSEESIEARIYFHRSLSGIQDAASLRGFLVGAKKASACGEWLKARGVDTIRPYPDSRALIDAAVRGDIRVFCMDTPPANYFLYRSGLSSSFHESPPLYTAPIHWAVRAGQVELRDFVQRGFDRIARADLDRVETRWHGNPLRSPPDGRFLFALATVPAALLAFSGFVAIWNRSVRLRLEARAQYFSTRDALTDLPARPLLYDRLSQALTQAEPRQMPVAVLFVDLDRFKAVNDTYGHAAGDRVLKEAALRVKRCARSTDTVARISSDEFVVVLAGLEKTDDAAIFARKVLAELQRPFDLDGQPVYCTASIGIAVHPGDGSSASTLIQNADIAMYRAKERGRNNFQFFLPEMHQDAVRRLQIETALRGALTRKEFQVHYQPRIDVKSGAITGFEALLRWRHPQFGLLSPSEFIPVLEDTDLIVPVGEWVLTTVCRQIATWKEHGVSARPVAVNLSARQFRMANLDQMVARIIDDTGIDAALLELELTETLLMQDPEETVVTLRNLEKKGVRLAVDDFGTGYSSLMYLKRFPIDSLKIDRAFVSDATSNSEDAAITLAIINLGHSLGLRVVAEGVETEAQLTFLRENGCDEMQGFLFSGAVPAEETEALLGR